MNETLKNGKKPNFQPNFDPCGQNLGPQIYFVSFTTTNSQTFFQAIILWNLKEN